jgi:hypothetical protein
MSEEPTEVTTETKEVKSSAKSYFSKQAIRQFIGVSLTFLVCWETVVSNQIDATVLIGIYGTVLGFYFGEGD